MKVCIDCHKFLTDKNRSSQQPSIRCSECFPGFLLAELENVKEWAALNADCEPEYRKTII